MRVSYFKLNFLSICLVAILPIDSFSFKQGDKPSANENDTGDNIGNNSGNSGNNGNNGIEAVVMMAAVVMAVVAVANSSNVQQISIVKEMQTAYLIMR